MKIPLLIILFGIEASIVTVLGQSTQPAQRPIGSNELSELIRRQEKQILESDNGDIHVEGRVIAAPILANAILQLSKKRDSPQFTIKECTIEGDLKLDKRRITIPLRFEQVVFRGELSGAGATFDDSLEFQDCLFWDRVSFGGATIHEIWVGLDIANKSPSAFMADVNFSGVTFTGRADFSLAVFCEEAGFEHAIFKLVANFEGTSFMLGHFNHAIFLGPAYFRSALFLDWFGLDDVTFEKEAIFNKAAFKDAGVFSNTKFKGPAEFGDASFEEADFHNAAFSDDISFNHTQFNSYAGFASTRFLGELDFDGCRFPSRKSPQVGHDTLVGLNLLDTRFEKRVRLTFDQLLDSPSWVPFTSPPTKLGTSRGDYRTVRIWENLEQTFQSANDLSSRNEAEYQKNLALSQLPDTNRLQSLTNWFNRVFWGYGVRPGRVLVWLFLTYSIFVFVYWTQTRRLAEDIKGIRGQWERFVFSLKFSWNTTYRLTYGYEHSRTAFFRFLTLLQSFGTKVLIFFFFKSLANTSPLINELFNKVLPR